MEKMNIHEWFGLTYTSYLVLHRNILQSMSEEWQEKFTAMLDDLADKYSLLPDVPDYFWVHAKDVKGKFKTDPYKYYERGRRDVFKEHGIDVK